MITTTARMALSCLCVKNKCGNFAGSTQIWQNRRTALYSRTKTIWLTALSKIASYMFQALLTKPFFRIHRRRIIWFFH